MKLSKIQKEIMEWLDAGQVATESAGRIFILHRARCRTATMRALVRKGLVKQVGESIRSYVAVTNEAFAHKKHRDR